MAQNIFIFEEEDVIVSVPKKYKKHEILVGKKDLNVTLPFKRPVINLWVYYYDRKQNKVAVTNFNPPMEIWIGYMRGEKPLKLYYWDVAINKKVALPHRKVRNWHKMQVFEGYGHVKVKTWPDDPNVGWD